MSRRSRTPLRAALIALCALLGLASALALAVPASAAPQWPLHEGDTGPRVAALQQRLAWLGYDIHPSNTREQRLGTSTITAVNELRAKFGYLPASSVSQLSWDLARSTAGRIGSLPAPCMHAAAAICIDKRQRLLRYVANGTVLLTTDARFGQPGEETRNGNFHVQRRERTNWSSEYDTSMPYSLFFSGAQAIHYSHYFARDGYAGASHGCINLRDRRAARWLFRHAPVGTPVIVYSRQA